MGKLQDKDVPVRLTLGAYGFPDNGTEVIHKSDGNAKAIIFKGKDFAGRKRQVILRTKKHTIYVLIILRVTWNYKRYISCAIIKGRF